MRYNTQEEIEATGEWLLRVNTAEISEELLYVPSELSKLGVAPIDVVDRLEYLRESKGHPVEVEAHEEPEDEQEPEEDEPLSEEEEPAAQEDALGLVRTFEERPALPVLEPLVLDYDGYGAWEWAEPIEKMVEDAILAVYDLVPDLPEFNQLALQSRPKQPRARGKRARSAAPGERANELVSIISVGATQ